MPTYLTRDFTLEELRCSHCGKLRFTMPALRILQLLRTELGFPLIVNSGYRCAEHPIEAAKPMPGPHSITAGDNVAVDVRLYGSKAYDLVMVAPQYGFEGIGLHQHGPHEKRFVHIDRAPGALHSPRPFVWTYDRR